MNVDARVQSDLRAAKLTELKKARDKNIEERVLVMLFMQNLERARYGKKYE